MNTRIFKAEVRDEILAIVREPAALFFSVLMPVGFFAIFMTMFGADGAMGMDSVATYGTFAVLSVVMMNPGVGIADARERGWLRVQRVSGTPVPVSLAAKVTGSLPYAVGTMAALTLVAVIGGSARVEVGQLSRVIAVLVIGALPFSLFSLTVGSKFSPNGTTAVLNAVLIPSVLISGLWFPLEMLPTFLQRVAEYMPPYHLAELALAQVNGGSVWDHVAFLVGTLVVGAIVASMAYGSAQP